MSDDDLLQTVREEFAQVRLTAPVDQILARGQALRRRHRLVSSLGAAAGTAGLAAALTVGLVSSSAITASAEAAWSVKSGPGHTVSLTIRDQPQSRPDGLRLVKALRAVGVSAVVRATLPGRCRQAPSSAIKIYAIPSKAGHHRTVIRIYARKIPAGSHVAIAGLRPVPAPNRVKIKVVRHAHDHGLISVRSLRPRVAMVTRTGLCVSPSR
ncbi:MAG TPA: hypothetical protein VGL63_09060 [Streptosporangiaceae bacterium]|jgi:hypothetical protein